MSDFLWELEFGDNPETRYKAGKTTLCQKLAAHVRGMKREQGQMDASSEQLIPKPTVGLELRTVKTSGVEFKVVDLSGQKAYHSIWSRYYAQSHIVIFVIDSADSSKLEESGSVLQNFVLGDVNLHCVPLLVVCSKNDIPGAMTVEDVEWKLRDRHGLGKREYHMVSISAWTGDGVGEILQWLTTQAKAK